MQTPGLETPGLETAGPETGPAVPGTAPAVPGTAPAGHVLRAAAIRKAYGAQTVLDGVDLTVPAGCLTALVGRSGSGKTTLLRLLAGFDRPDAGTITIGDRLVAGPGRQVPPERRRIGYVTQEGSLFPHLTVAGNIAFGWPWRARWSRRNRRDVGELLDLVGLPERYLRRFPHELSGGEQQRVALARALAPRPDAILLDEPFSALDPELRATTRQAVTAALAATGTTTVLVTHDRVEALSIASRVALLRDGAILQEDTPTGLYHRPVDHQVAAFVGDLTVVPAALRGSVADTPLGAVPLRHDQHGTGRVFLRPEQVEITEPGAGHTDATVLTADFRGADGLLALRVGTPSGDVDVTARCAAHHLPAAGQRVGVRVSGPATATAPADSDAT
ncbi:MULTISPECIES: ABC transporter ATP-binding protein [Parafrankia]|nr:MULTISPECIES: ABC transporter ATP-binding protein [Parafrankia]MBE3201514.1 ABC transporter ATP-binding protein [Parafrankia sp. CH37]